MKLLLDIYEKILWICKTNIFLICIFFMILIFIFTLYYFLNLYYIKKIKEISEENWCIISKEQQILNYSENFFKLLNVEKDNLWFFMITQLKLGEKIMNIMYNNSSFAFNYYEKNITFFFRYNQNCLYVYFWKNTDIWQSLPIKIFNECSDLYSKYNNYLPYNLPFKGNFLLGGEEIFRKEENKNYGIITPFINLKDWEDIYKNINLFQMINNLPVNYLVLDILGNILYISELCISNFSLKREELLRINDFFNMVRGTIFPETISFNEMKQIFIMKLKSLKEESSILYTLTDKALQIRLKNINNIIFMIFEEISDLNIKKEEIICTDILDNLSDLIVIGQNNKVTYSNNELININSPMKEAKCLLSNFGEVTESENINYNYLVLNRNIESEVDYIRLNIGKYMDKIAMLFGMVGTESKLLKEFDIKEYEKYTQYVKYIIDNNLRTLEIKCQKKIIFELFNFFEVFSYIKKQLEHILTFKNLTIEITCQENLIVYAHQPTIELLIENILLLAFQNQFINKKIKIWRDDHLCFMLEGLPKDQQDLDIFKVNFGIQPILSIGDKLSIGFSINDKS